MGGGGERAGRRDTINCDFRAVDAMTNFYISILSSFYYIIIKVFCYD